MEETISKFVKKHNKLLFLEQEESFSRNYKDISPAIIYNLEKNGQALSKLKIVNIAHSGPGKFQIDFELSNELLLESNLSQGDLVICIEGKKSSKHVRGIIINVSNTMLSISSNDSFDIEEENFYTVLKTDSDFTYICQKKALINLEKNRDSIIRRILFDKDKNAVQSLLTSELPIIEKCLNEEKLLKFANNSLAVDQKAAVEFALKRKYFAIIQGPPGTGKTTTLVELIIQLHRHGKKILVCAPTNVAVDNIAMKLGETEVKPLRLGHFTRIMKEAQKYSIDSYIQRDDSYAILQDIKRSIKALETNSEKMKNYKEIRELNKEYKKRSNKLNDDIIKKFQVILSTLNSSSSKGYLQHLENDHFDVLIVDEASQALEASMWIGIPNAPKLVLAGDINQLPPTVLCQEAINQGLNISLMERAIKKLGKESFVTLTRQYRMNEKIMLWSSKRFYENSLQADDTVKYHLLKDLPDIKESSLTAEPLVFVDTCGCECEEYQTVKGFGSKGNVREAVVVNKVISSLIQSGLSEKNIGIITPYALQVDLIRKSLLFDSINIEVNTVDGFQGREKEVIILSLVRSNLEKELGFLTDFRRLNVAVTRARRLLVVIGNSETVEKNDMLASLLTHIGENGLLKTAEEYLSVQDDFELKVEQTAEKQKKHNNKSSTIVLKQKEESKVQENLKITTKDVKNIPKLNDKGIDLSSCENRKAYNIFNSIVSNESEEADENEGENKSEELKESKVKKKKNKTKVKTEFKSTEKNEDFNTIIEELSRTNNCCSFKDCKISTQLIHLNCEFCKNRFCLQHGMQEIHGCGEAIRRKERKEFRQRMPEPAKKKDKDRFAQKLKQFEEARKPKATKEELKKSKKK
ncbi:DNA-binding protein SMUBP-2-like [Leptopilina boulardi]|uniref:DNA-binding protein SMUBP-2-like n=1 Tax=Leptopilina boulardi TaxID=63433 RepID=UPI0021F64A40|nr:DNA-binding protein SMUBP-2-like [Leptopilina boulardi]